MNTEGYVYRGGKFDYHNKHDDDQLKKISQEIHESADEKGIHIDQLI